MIYSFFDFFFPASGDPAFPSNRRDRGRRAERPPVDLYLTVTNAGKGSTFLAPEAVTLTLLFDRPGLEEVETGGFDAAETFFGGSSTPALQANLRRANGVRFRKCYLAPGETAKAGPIRIPADGATKVWGSWQAIGAGGFDAARGAIETLDLSLHSLFSILHSPPSRR